MARMDEVSGNKVDLGQMKSIIQCFATSFSFPWHAHRGRKNHILETNTLPQNLCVGWGTTRSLLLTFASQPRIFISYHHQIEMQFSVANWVWCSVDTHSWPTVKAALGGEELLGADIDCCASPLLAPAACFAWREAINQIQNRHNLSRKRIGMGLGETQHNCLVVSSCGRRIGASSASSEVINVVVPRHLLSTPVCGHQGSRLIFSPSLPDPRQVRCDLST